MTRPLTAGDLALVSLGAAAGATARWSVTQPLPESLTPWLILAINVVGALALGALPALPAARRSHRLTLLLGPGLLGGFTTVSAWSEDVRRLTASGDLVLAGALVGATLLAGLAAAWCGRRLAHRAEPEDALT